MAAGHEQKEVQSSPALPPRREKGIGIFRSRSGSASSVPETEAVHRSNSEERHRAGSGEQRWKLMGKKERGERATSPKASKKGKTKKELASGASPALIPASSQLSVSSVPGGNDDALVLANPASRQSKV